MATKKLKPINDKPLIDAATNLRKTGAFIDELIEDLSRQKASSPIFPQARDLMSELSSLARYVRLTVNKVASLNRGIQNENRYMASPDRPRLERLSANELYDEMIREGFTDLGDEMVRQGEVTLKKPRKKRSR